MASHANKISAFDSEQTPRVERGRHTYGLAWFLTLQIQKTSQMNVVSQVFLMEMWL